MISSMIELSACIIEGLICTCFIIDYLGFKSTNYKIIKHVSLFILIMIGEVIATYSSLNEFYAIITFILSSIIFSLIFLDGSIKEKIFIPCMTYIFIVGINAFVLLIFSCVLTKQYSELIALSGISRILIIILTKVLLISGLKVILNFRNNKKLRLGKIEFSAIIFIFLMTLSICFFLRHIMLKYDYFSEIFIYITFCMIILNVCIIRLIIEISLKNMKELEFNLVKLQVIQQEKSMCEIDKTYKETLKLRHDLKNYISCAAKLAENNEFDELKCYLNKLVNVKISKYNHYIMTESRVLNAVLNNKFSDAEESNIDVKYEITGKLGTIDDTDFSIMLANLLDNAIEACKRNNKPSRISVKIYNHESYLLTKIINTYDYQSLGEKLCLETSKPDRKMHGIGLVSVNDIVEKYSGSSDFRVDNGNFIADIMLCNGQQRILL